MKYLIITLALIVALSFLWPNQSPEPPAKPIKAVTPTNLETKTMSEGGITITVTPQALSETEFIFRLTLDTHTEELNADLKRVLTLVDDQGRIYEPLEWEGEPPGGHHREGILRFATLDSKPEVITLKIKEISGASERQFVWIITNKI